MLLFTQYETISDLPPGVNFHFWALGYLKLGAPLEGLRRLTS